MTVKQTCVAGKEGRKVGHGALLVETGGNFLATYDISTKLRITSPFLCFVVLTRDCVVLFLDLLQTNSPGTLLASVERYQTKSPECHILLKRSTIKDLYNILVFFAPPLVTVTLKQLINSIFCTWANPATPLSLQHSCHLWTDPG